MNNAAKETLSTVTFYIVAVTTIVDRPELRDVSFRRVPQGTAIHQKITTRSRKSAISLAKAHLTGEYDFASEYVCSVRVERHTLTPGGHDKISTALKMQRRDERDARWVQPY